MSRVKSFVKIVLPGGTTQTRNKLRAHNVKQGNTKEDQSRTQEQHPMASKDKNAMHVQQPVTTMKKHNPVVKRKSRIVLVAAVVIVTVVSVDREPSHLICLPFFLFFIFFFYFFR